MTLGVASITGIGTIAALLWADLTQAEVAKGCAYSLVVICTSSLAMLIRSRGGDDGLGDGEPLTDPPPVDGDHDPPPFDWDDFERGFWDEVERRNRERIPA